MRKRPLIVLAVTVAAVAIAVAYGVPFGKRHLERRARSIQCANSMVSIDLAARMWANDHNQRLPPDLLSMSNELVSPKILHCPGDHARQRVHSWGEFVEASSSYEVVSPGARDGDTNVVYLRCKVHGHLGYADATVFDGRRRGSERFF
jgi:hypothetical protein